MGTGLGMLGSVRRTDPLPKRTGFDNLPFGQATSEPRAAA
jgi:hypothetical protein